MSSQTVKSQVTSIMYDTNRGLGMMTSLVVDSVMQQSKNFNSDNGNSIKAKDVYRAVADLVDEGIIVYPLGVTGPIALAVSVIPILQLVPVEFTPTTDVIKTMIKADIGYFDSEDVHCAVTDMCKLGYLQTRYNQKPSYEEVCRKTDLCFPLSSTV